MGSLPDLTDRARTDIKPASRTLSDPNRNRIQIRPSFLAVEWSKTGRLPNVPQVKRKDSCSSSVGTASMRRLLNHRPPPRPSNLPFIYFLLLCASKLLVAAALMPMIAVMGAEQGGLLLTLMYSVAALVAPFSNILLIKLGLSNIVNVAQVLLVILFVCQIGKSPFVLLVILYCVAGLGLGPISLVGNIAATNAANSLSVGAGNEEIRRRVLLRRLLRTLRAAQDVGLLIGSVVLGMSVNAWPSSNNGAVWNVTDNVTILPPRWPPILQETPAEDDYEENLCGSNGCPDSFANSGSALSNDGRQILFIIWSVFVIMALLLTIIGSRTLTPVMRSELVSFNKIRKEPNTFFGLIVALFIGMQIGFLLTSFVKWYGVCVVGWDGVWSTLCGAAILQALAAATLSMAAARGMRGALTFGGAASHGCLLLALLRWRAARADAALPVVTAAAWGVCGALWDVLQSSSVIGRNGWSSHWSLIISARHIGIAVACAGRYYFCVETQIFILAATLLMAFLAQAFIEMRLRKLPAHRLVTTNTINS